jgi:pimeloyl-ACP methyl ester carboxylesterase
MRFLMPNQTRQAATVVLVHGAWMDAGMWNSVILPLRRDGLLVMAAQLPLTSFKDDLAALQRTLDRTDGSLILVGHCYAGALITNATLNVDRVKALVHISTITPRTGETIDDVLGQDSPRVRSALMQSDSHGFIWATEELFKMIIAPQASPHQWTLMTATQKPMSRACFVGSVLGTTWRAIPSWYLVAELDRVVAPAIQNAMAQRMNARVRSHPVDHVSPVTEPEPVLEMILEATTSQLN